MNRSRLRRAVVACSMALLLSACGGGADDPAAPAAGGTPPPGTTGTGSPGGSGSTGGTGSAGGTGSTSSGGVAGGPVHAGMGDSTAAPTGRTWAWPQGVQVSDPIPGDDPSCVPDEQHATPRVGHGGLVRLCLGFRNTGLVPVTVTLPPGLIFVSTSLEGQNGLVLTVTTIVVPATSTTFYVPVQVFCLNLGRHDTLSAEDTYKLGPVTDDPSVLELLALLQDKQLSPAFDFQLQQILWDITENGGLTPEDREALAAL